MQDLIPVNGLISLYGRPKSMKSYLAISLALAMTQGTTWMGYPIINPGPVLYLQIDTPRSLWEKRWQKLVEAGIDLHNSPGLFLADRLNAPHPFNILDPKHALWLRSEVERTGAKLVILDTLRKLHRLDEDKSAESDLVLTSIQVACGQAAVLLISHGKKLGADREEHSVVEGNRGSSNTPAACDIIFQLRRQGKEATLSYEGRAVEDDHIKLLLDQKTLLWNLHPDALYRITLKQLAEDTSYPSLRAKAKRLSETTNRSFDACLKALERFQSREE